MATLPKKRIFLHFRKRKCEFAYESVKEIIFGIKLLNKVYKIFLCVSDTIHTNKLRRKTLKRKKIRLFNLRIRSKIIYEYIRYKAHYKHDGHTYLAQTLPRLIYFFVLFVFKNFFVYRKKKFFVFFSLLHTVSEFFIPLFLSIGCRPILLC